VLKDISLKITILWPIFWGSFGLSYRPKELHFKSLFNPGVGLVADVLTDLFSSRRLFETPQH
jgi:predicted membrane protein